MQSCKSWSMASSFLSVAHRGGGCEVAENSLAGILHGIEVGSDIVEFDVRATKDGVVVLLHDEDLMRVAGVDRKLAEVSFAELQKLQIFHKEPFVTFDEVLEQTKKTRCFVEIKEVDIVSKVMGTIAKYEAFNRCTIISFFEEALVKAKRIEPKIQTGLIYYRGKIETAKEIGADLVLPYYKIATKKANDFAHSLGLKVGVWSVNKREDIEKMIENKADFIASDYPTMLVGLKGGRD